MLVNDKIIQSNQSKLLEFVSRNQVESVCVMVRVQLIGHIQNGLSLVCWFWFILGSLALTVAVQLYEQKKNYESIDGLAVLLPQDSFVGCFFIKNNVILIGIHKTPNILNLDILDIISLIFCLQIMFGTGLIFGIDPI